ncbi:L-lactate permease [Saxibacter everestensis]|uniref:L-lactate permease n=1 Tax=Saxibacter everestensis TaxID=2909229 RepID=A0ABY8QS98_9MICO|nr:L-lactate permease [Brevibacteriaceae bacterium ZFBP1038]
MPAAFQSMKDQAVADSPRRSFRVMSGWLALAAAAPIGLAAVLLALRINPTLAALGSCFAAVIISLLWFPVSGPQAAAVAGSLGPSFAEVLLIVLGGIALAEVLGRSGAQEKISGWILSVCPAQGRAVILLVLGVTPFAESVTGFGLGIIVAIPILRRVGFSATRSAVIGLLGLVLVPWGSLAPGLLISARLGDVEFSSLGLHTALLTLPVLLVMVLAALYVGLGRKGVTGHLAEAVVVSLAMWLVLLAVNAFLSPPLAGVVASLTAVILVLLRSRLQAPLEFPWPVRRALLPYAVLILGLLLTSVVTTIFGLAGPWDALRSPAFWLLVTAALAPMLVGADRSIYAGLLPTVLRMWRPIGLSTAAFLLLGAILTGSGMSAYAATYVAGMGAGYLFLLPFIGAASGFITGSNTGASAMLSTSASASAHALGIDPVVTLAAQNVSASALAMAAPPKIIFAAGLANRGLPGRSAMTTKLQRAAIFRTVLGAHAVLLPLLGGLTLLLAVFG